MKKRSVRAMEIISKIITNVLTALYQPFWFTVILSVLVYVHIQNLSFREIGCERLDFLV